MHALVLEAPDFPPVYKKVDTPKPGEGQALVKLHAAALNHRDVWIMQGKYPGIKYPIVLGSDGAGVVDAVGPHEKVKILGREVIINPGINWGKDEAYQSKEFEILGLPENGTFAEYVTVPIENIHDKPEHLSMEQAAALPLAGLTAWRALMTRGQFKKGEKVLITGIGGGVALFALQFAAAAGAEIFVTSSSQKKIAQAIKLGARGGANYTEENWEEQITMLSNKPFDVVIDGAGGEGFATALKLLGPGGRAVFYGGTAGKWPKLLPQHLFYKQIEIKGSTMGSPKEFEEMLAFINEHKIEPVVSETVPLREGADAFLKMDRGEQFGKLVLKMTT